MLKRHSRLLERMMIDIAQGGGKGKWRGYGGGGGGEGGQSKRRSEEEEGERGDKCKRIIRAKFAAQRFWLWRAEDTESLTLLNDSILAMHNDRTAVKGVDMILSEVIVESSSHDTENKRGAPSASHRASGCSSDSTCLIQATLLRSMRTRSPTTRASPPVLYATLDLLPP
eukprot:157300-Hanusia_phi.AAC.3